MTSPDPVRVAAIALTFLIAGTVKGVTGMGLPTVAMGVLGTLMLPVEAASLLILPSFVTNVWQLLAGPRLGALVRRFWLMMAGIVIGTVAAASFIAGSGGVWAVTGLGAALTLYAASGLLSWHVTVPPRHEQRLSPVIGVVTGLVTGGTGVFVVPAVPYLQALDLKKERSRPGARTIIYGIDRGIGDRACPRKRVHNRRSHQLAARRRPCLARYVDRSTHTRPHQPRDLSALVLYLHAGARSSTAVAAFDLSVAPGHAPGVDHLGDLTRCSRHYLKHWARWQYWPALRSTFARFSAGAASLKRNIAMTALTFS